MKIDKSVINKEIPDSTVFFDGVCNLCNYWVKFIDRMDKKKIISLCHLQNNLGLQIQDEIFKKYTVKSLSTIIFYHNNKIYLKSSAVLKVMSLTSRIGFFYKSLMILPTFFRDFFYDLVGKTRYIFFGKTSECQIPNKDLLARFIHKI
jgi:predicted DCC family thiol-disulfide oxidoreductase YuxK